MSCVPRKSVIARLARLTAAAAGLAAALPAAAQNAVPGLENFTLERPQPSPAPTVAPTATPTPAPTPAPTAPPPLATPGPTPTAAPAAPIAPRASVPSPTPTDPVAPRAVPSPITAASPPAARPTMATPTPAPSVTDATNEASPAVAPVASDGAATSWNWRWGAALGAALLIAAGLLWWRRRRADEGLDEEEATSAPLVSSATSTAPVASAPPEPAPPTLASLPPVTSPPAAPPPAAPRPGGLVTSALKPELRLTLQPRRGGVDALRATLEYDLHLANVGRASARGVTIEAWLLSASHDTDAHLERIFASAIGEPMLAPFDLTASAAFELSGVAVCPREALAVITAGERRMFVPVLAIRVGYQDTRGAPQGLTLAYLIGTQREGQDRLAPLPLDRGSRMHERLAARRHGE